MVRMFSALAAVGWILAAHALVVTGCGNDDGLRTGLSCAGPDDCYSDVDHAELKGDVLCLDRIEGGYCTHTCQSDADCCAVAGECPSGRSVVCGPFESTGINQCFLSCEEPDVDGMDPTAYCQEHAHPDFICRSTGGGAANRKVCVPGG